MRLETTQHDVVIVGGGPAGLATALTLVRERPSLAGRVVVLEKGTYPREKPCAGAIGARGLKILAALDAVPDVPHVPIDGISFRGRDGELAATLSGIGWVVRRIEFDAALAAIARSRGIAIKDDTRVSAVRVEAGQAVVVSSRGEHAAPVVVGADGVGSVVRRAMGLSAGKLRAQVLELDTEPVRGDRDRALLHFDASDRRIAGYTWDFPTVVDGEALVCRGIYRLKVGDGASGEDASDLHALFADRLAAQGLDIGRYKQKRYAERGLEPAERVASGPLMLVGEAAGIDPVTGEGIAQALEFGALAGRLLAQRGARSPDAWETTLRRSRLAFDLRIRRGFVPLFYGHARAGIEDFILESPDALHVGCQHFAAEPYDTLRLAEVLARGAARYVAMSIGRALGR